MLFVILSQSTYKQIHEHICIEQLHCLLNIRIKFSSFPWVSTSLHLSLIFSSTSLSVLYCSSLFNFLYFLQPSEYMSFNFSILSFPPFYPWLSSCYKSFLFRWFPIFQRLLVLYISFRQPPSNLIMENINRIISVCLRRIVEVLTGTFRQN